MSAGGPDIGAAPAGRERVAPDALAAEERLYPELAAHGQLARVIGAAAARLGIDLGEVTAGRWGSPRHSACVGSIAPDREPMQVNIGIAQRTFIVSGWSRGVALVGGSTPDLEDIVRATAAWRRGACLDEIAQAASFVEFSDLSRAHERGPADAVAEKWRRMRASWSRDERFRAVADIIEASHAEPALRQLFPYTSHESLRFSTCTGYPYSHGMPLIEPRRHGGYVLRYPNGDAIGEAGDAASAIAILLAHLPAGTGPAATGHA